MWRTVVAQEQRVQYLEDIQSHPFLGLTTYERPSQYQNQAQSHAINNPRGSCTL